jgi:DNA (cytosine-5)-methyltransferase 1
MKHGSLFSGIGGFDLAAQWMGWENVFHCEIAEFPLKVLQHYWPNAISYENIIETDFTKHRGHIDVISGGFPCQPYSLAGKRLGKEDARHLWPEMLRCIREIQPKWVVGENVFGIVNWSGGLVFDEVQSDLEAQGYEVQAYVLPACAVNAPHRRDRVWFVAHASDPASDRRQRAGEGFKVEKGLQPRPGTTGELEGGFERLRHKRDAPHAPRKQNQRHGQGGFQSESSGFDEQRDAADPENAGQQTCSIGQGEKQFGRRNQPMGSRQWDRFPTQSPVCRRDDGLSSQLDGITFSKWRNESIKAYGNAVVPQVVYEIFKAIEEWENKY